MTTYPNDQGLAGGAIPVWITAGGGSTTPVVGSAALNTGQANVTGTAGLIVAARTGTPGTGRIAATIVNTGSIAIYVGNTGVTTGTGLPIPAGGAMTINTTAAIYGITSTGTQVAAFLETF